MVNSPRLNANAFKWGGTVETVKDNCKSNHTINREEERRSCSRLTPSVYPDLSLGCVLYTLEVGVSCAKNNETTDLHSCR
jgi:hypothetical protein